MIVLFACNPGSFDEDELGWIMGYQYEAGERGRRDDCLLVCLGVLGQSLRVQQRGVSHRHHPPSTAYHIKGTAIYEM